MPRIVPLPGTDKTPRAKRGGSAPRALTVADMLTMSPAEVAALVQTPHTRRVLAVMTPDPESEPARTTTHRGQMHIAYDRENPHRAEHARHLNTRARRIVCVGEFAGYYNY